MSVYTPFYDEYVDGCTLRRVDEYGVVRAHGNGTALARNAYAIAHNVAVHPGNSARIAGLERHDARRVDLCATHSTDSAQRQAEAQEELDQLVVAHANAQADIALMRRCYATAALDVSASAARAIDSTRRALAAAGRGQLSRRWARERGGAEAAPSVAELTGWSPPRASQAELERLATAGQPLLDTTAVPAVPFGTLSASLGDVQCDASFENTTLHDGVHDCTVLRECDLPCDSLTSDDGKDSTNLNAFAIGAACTVEWFGHSLVLQVAFSVAIFCFLNVGRLLLVKGVIRVCWNMLNTGYFLFRATCNRDGQKTYHSDDLADRLDTMLGRIKTIGVALILAAICVQIPWIVAYVNYNNVNYEGSIVHVAEQQLV